MPENYRSSGVWDSKECVLVLIDYQPGVMSYIRSHDPKAAELNARYLAKAAVAFDIPIILSTVGVQLGVNQPTIASLRAEIPQVPEIDRSSMDSWGDKGFVDAVKKTGRKRLVMSGILTAVCLAYPTVAASGPRPVTEPASIPVASWPSRQSRGGPARPASDSRLPTPIRHRTRHRA
jgi:hypothetical protein